MWVFFLNFISNLKTMTFATLVAIYKPFMSLAIINVFSEQYHLSTKSVVVHDCGAKRICSHIAWLWGNGIPLKCVSVKMKVNINKYIWLLLHWTKDIRNCSKHAWILIDTRWYPVQTRKWTLYKLIWYNAKDNNPLFFCFVHFWTYFIRNFS